MGRRSTTECTYLPTYLTQWLVKENGKAVKVKITDLKIDKIKQQGQI